MQQVKPLPRPLSLKVAFAACVLLVVAHAAASGHAHEGDHADEVCLVCVASAELAPDTSVPVHASGLATAGGESDGQAAASFPVHLGDYWARAPPSS
ncbi:MAG: hypothetical protein OXH15_15710 [Gammaproteobacteria bacterium]|nr:hypothetical protein [Gammaproteobacteria bacterium]